jgi:hypothetical protein
MQNTSGDILPSSVTVKSASPVQAHAYEKPTLSFISHDKIRKVAEFIIAAKVGALLLFLFFMASELAVFFMKDTPFMAVTFVPVICLLPLLAGALAAIVLEKLRKAQPSIKAGAFVGFLAGFCGSLFSSFILAVLSVLNMKPFGDSLSSQLIVFAILMITIGIDTVLGALGGALVVKFTSDK